MTVICASTEPSSPKGYSIYHFYRTAYADRCVFELTLRDKDGAFVAWQTYTVQVSAP